MRNRSEELLLRVRQTEQDKVKSSKTRSDVLYQFSPTDGSLKSRYLLKALRLYFFENMGYRTIGRIIPVSESSIAIWIRTFAKQHTSKSEIMEAIVNLENNADQQPSLSSMDNIISKVVKDDKSEETPESPENEIRRLKEELKYQRLRADAYNEMITVAEQQFSINIRKKAGAKQ